MAGREADERYTEQPDVRGPAADPAPPLPTEPIPVPAGDPPRTASGLDPSGPVPPPGAPPTTPPPGASPSRPGRRPSRVGGVWLASILFAVVLLLLLIFILENGQSAEISFFGAHGHLPQGVALLLAAVCGILLVAIPGTARILQLRLRARRRRGTDTTPPR